MRHRILSGLALAMAFPVAALAQGDEKPQQLTLPTAMLTDGPGFQVDEALGSGEMTISPQGPFSPTQFVYEGYYLLVPGGPEAKAMARVQVTNVRERSVTMKTSAEAAKAFPKGTNVKLVRPFQVTTNQMIVLPELMTLDDPQSGMDGEGQDSRTAAALMRSINNMKQIGLGLHNYYSANEHLPPAVVRGPDGKPWHSWRVLILPYLEQGTLYNEYDFSQPWDSEKNKKLIDKMPAVYRDPIYADAKGGFTNYAVISGEGTLFPPEGAKLKKDGPGGLNFDPEGLITFANVLDGTSNTVAVAPIAPDRKVPWTKPEDIAFGDEFPALGDPKGIALPYNFAGKKVAPVLLMDGSVQLLPATTNPVVVNTLITRAGGELVGANTFQAIQGAPLVSGTVTLTITKKAGKATATIR